MDVDPKLSGLDLLPFALTVGIEPVTIELDEVVLRLDWDAPLCTTGGILHGGALMTLADCAGALSAFLNLPEDGTGTLTVESKSNFFRPVRSGYVLATARPVHRGRTLTIVETEIRDGGGELVAKTSQTQMTTRAR